MAHGVEIVETTQIPPSPLPHPPPRPVKLSLFDSFWMMLPPVQKLLLYSNPTTTTSAAEFSSLLQDLKSSLASVLSQNYLPLAGKLVHVASTGDVEIDLSDPSATFIEAESDLDLNQLATSETHDVRSFMKLVPAIDVSVLPFPVFAVQVTRFGCGGLAVGYSVHHAVVDGKGMMQFLEAWAKTCKAKIGGCGAADEVVLLGGHERRSERPSYDRAVIQHPKGDEISRKILQKVAPALPKTVVGSIESIEERRLLCSRRTFVLNAQSIQSLKKRATDKTNAEARPPSTFTVVSAYTWLCFVRTKSFDPSAETANGVLMDCRTRLNPPLNEDYFGNCLVPIIIKIPVSELMGDDGLIRACSTMTEAIREGAKDPLGNFENLFDKMQTLPFDKMVNGTASPRFQVYEIDFGWGKPARFESVSMNRDMEFALVAGKEQGSVQVSVVADPNQIETFANLFVIGLISA